MKALVFHTLMASLTLAALASASREAIAAERSVGGKGWIGAILTAGQNGTVSM